MLRSVLPSLLLISVLSVPAAMAQQNSKKAAAPAPMADATPAPAAPATDGFAAPAGRVADAPAPQSEGFSIAPGFTAAPSRRVNTDYRGRMMAPYVRRNVREAAPVAAPMPMPAPEPVAAPEPEPVAAAEPAPAAKKAATTTTKKAAPAKKAAKKPVDDGWGSGGSGW